MSGRTPAPPEDSLPGRIAVLGAAAIADAAIIVTAGLVFTPVASFGMVALGHWVSWRGRRSPRRRRGQALLAALILGALAYLLLDLFLSTFGGALPQAKFALIAQAITAFDLKSRRNLFTHLWHSLAVLYVAALFGFTAVFVPFVILWGAAAWLFLHWTARPKQGKSEAWRPALVPIATAMTAWLLCGVVIFALLPRFPARPLAVPIVVSLPFTNVTAETLPPALPLIGGTSSPSSGFNLRARGRFGDEVVFYVRATGVSYWQTSVLHRYTHTEWLRGNADAVAAPAPGVLIHPPVLGEPGGGTGTLSQSFFIERQVGPEIISAYPLTELYFPSRRVLYSPDGTIHAPGPLSPGLIYTAVSELRDISPGNLRATPPLVDSDRSSDTQLPGDMPSRVLRLADQLNSESTEYDQVLADVRYLRANERYSLDTPRLPTGADAVDQFLFVDHVGFCEQFASAMAVILRRQGIPARVAIGYLPGDRDSFTGTYTVRNHDAHAWTEVYFPGVGWVSVDASPGYSTTPSPHSTGAAFLGGFTVDVSSFSLASSASLVPVVAPVALASVFALLTVAWWRRRHVPGAVRRYRDAQWWLRQAGLPARLPHQTVREHLAQLGLASAPAANALSPLARGLEAALYGAPEAGDLGSIRAVARVAISHRASGVTSHRPKL